MRHYIRKAPERELKGRLKSAEIDQNMTKPVASAFEKARYMLSVPDLYQCPADNGFELAFAGRSNAGKSSALNTLTRNSKLARTSRTPGRTQLLNFFGLDDQRRMVDLPGYGYAKVPDAVKRQWQENIDNYLRHRQSLKGLVLVMDIRHPLTEFDSMMLDWAMACEMPVHVLLTKADKLKRGAQAGQLKMVKKALAEYEGEVSIQTFSALKRTGVEELATVLAGWLELPLPE